MLFPREPVVHGRDGLRRHEDGPSINPVEVETAGGVLPLQIGSSTIIPAMKGHTFMAQLGAPHIAGHQLDRSLNGSV